MSERPDRMQLAAELLLDAKAFRENPIYSQDGDPVYLIANAERYEAAAAALLRSKAREPWTCPDCGGSGSSQVKTTLENPA